MATLQDALAEVRKNGRICPMPQKWNELYQLLPNTKQSGDGGWQPALPLILAAWYEAPTMLKMIRLTEHLEWADKHGCIDRIYDFLVGLEESEWHHSG